MSLKTIEPPASTPASATDIASPWKRTNDRQRERETKREAVLRMAAKVFNERGFHATSLDEVADRLHVTRPTLYYYFKNKDEILFECVRLGLEMLRSGIAESDRNGGSAYEKLVACMRVYAKIVTMDFGMCLIRIGEDPLAEGSRRQLRALKAGIDREFRRLIEEGVAEGSLVSADPRITAFTIAGGLSWIARWYRPDGALDADELGERCIAVLLQGVAPRAAAPALAVRRRRSV